ncbi:MAG: endopeptidase La [Lentisphaeria bacterium]|nr:endopeptidase La [Lentisphaeria bacterium]
MAEKKIKRQTISDQESLSALPERMSVPAIALSGVLVFPYALTPLVIDGEESIELIQKVADGDRLIALFPEFPQDPVEVAGLNLKMKTLVIEEKKVLSVGTLGRIVKMLRFPDNTVRVLVRGLCRIKASSYNGETHLASFRQLKEETENEIEIQAMVRNAIKQFQEVISFSPNYPEDLKIAILNMNNNTRITDLITDALNISYAEKLAILTLPKLQERLQLLTILLNREVEVLKLGSEIQTQVHNAMSKSQREFFLREQLRTIKEELGEETRNPDLAELRKRLNNLNAPEQVIQTVKKELDRIESIPPSAPDYTVSYNYIDWILNLPWNNMTEDRLDIHDAAEILERDHYGLKDVKERILEFLSVLQLKKDKKAPILCFSGPPGVGKTSLGKSIADAMGRKFVRMSLGGIKDEAEIRGHRRTYIGALPGRILQGLKKAGSSNPVFMLDEIDKIGNDFRGDPASALLEVLDPQQNFAFHDNFLELDYNLENVMFIATANLLETIPAPLLDRMDIITLPGYTPLEKQKIAEQYLIPRQITENGLEDKMIRVTDDAAKDIISLYTREAGVRTLERTIGAVLRKTARKVVENKFDPKKDSVITPATVKKALGAPRYLNDEIPASPEIGTAVGMAWTSVGGTILQIEALQIPGGKGELKLTGSLGNVMKESALAAFSYIRSKAHEYGIPDDTFTKNDFHIHVPDGATPKDGPSAGVTLSTALISLLTNTPVENKVAMTGEITLRGAITAIGGVKEKSIGALCAGVTDIILPEENRKDTEKIPDEVKKKIKFHYVKTAQEAWKIAVPKLKPKKISAKRKK